MKRHHWAVLGAIAIAAWSCQADMGPSSKIAKGSVYLTDAPAADPNIASVVIYIDQIDASASSDSLTQVCDKLVRRHPHVFAREAGQPPLDSAGQDRVRWEEIKEQERAGKAGGAGKAGRARKR